VRPVVAVVLGPPVPEIVLGVVKDLSCLRRSVVRCPVVAGYDGAIVKEL